jgi:hypothetical protein
MRIAQVVGIGQSVAVLRGVHDGLGKKENILSSAEAMNVQKVRQLFRLRYVRG